MSATKLAMRNAQSLKKLDPAKVGLTNAVLKLLSGEMNVVIASNIPDAKVFVADEHMAFAILSKNGNCILGSDESVDHTCDVLDAADSMLCYAEKALGIMITPVAVRPTLQSAFCVDDALILRISDREKTLLLAMRPDAEQSARWIEAARSTAPDLSAMPVPVSIEFEATKLPVADTARIEGGDMLLLPRCVKALWQSALPSTAQLPRNAVIDLRNMTLKFGGAYYDEVETGMSDDNTDDDTKETSASFNVPITIRLPTQYVDAATLAGLHEGSSLQLGPLVQGLPVELLVGSRRIAAGEIVEVGENFAVLIEKGGAPQPIAASTETAGEVDLRSPAPTTEGSTH
jgi:flagellar motor switch/type III secretory pathway protein FliN